ncbi:STAS domain-containing protein [Planomonospora sp. ID82291]|uniref:STAS domain-containing protein n=1 Tax=Planomonospora sp. ID82291 TaxID=2738136 RepID=UPI0018C437EC|nr:STAS domain-containing protein [Planomonospora sp. ID82291]MBG0816458.1 STAS domain-containing protein [Planomonospora sp. ID82291]
MLFAPDHGPAFTVSAGLYNDAVVVRACGALDAAGAPVLREQLHRLWGLSELPVVVVDLTETTFCDSTGLGVLVAALQRCEGRGTRLVLAGVDGVVARVLAITGLRTTFEICPTPADALRVAARRDTRSGEGHLSSA